MSSIPWVVWRLCGRFQPARRYQETLEQAKYFWLLMFKALFAIQAEQASPAAASNRLQKSRKTIFAKLYLTAFGFFTG